MELETIKSFSYANLIRNLPRIVRRFAIYMRMSTANHVWHRLNRRKHTIIADIPEEIEQYIINKLKCTGEIKYPEVNFALLLNVYWHVSHRPFEIILADIMNSMVLGIDKIYAKNMYFIIENTGRNNIRKFNPLYFGDMAWALCAFFSKLVENSKVISMPNKPDNYLFSKENNFPLIYNHEEISAEKDIDTILEKYEGEKYILYICKLIGNTISCYNRIDNLVNQYSKLNKTYVILWELRSGIKISTSYQNMKIIQGFSESNFLEVENMLKSMAGTAQKS